MKWWLKVILVVILAAIAAFLGISVYLGHEMTAIERVPVTETPALCGLDYEEVSFTSRVDELTLYGWFLPAGDGDEVIIMVHGAEQHRADPGIKMLDIGCGLVEHGYNVLMFDLRGHGESDGDRMSSGYYEVRDLGGAVDYVVGLGFEDIGVLGFSIGAVTAIMTAAEDDDIDAIISDSAYADLNDMLEPQFCQRTSFPKFFLRPLLFMVKMMYGIDFTAVKPVEVVGDIAPRPIFFIQGELDDTVPVAHAYSLLEASNNPLNELWVVPDVNHVEAYMTYPEEYMERVTAFFDDALR
ncbi:MAG TPA: alpha/beta hydrolase [Dehalococcoidales bacterium]|nr:alpha/beta hydrolase [Dehalococcoidales bacterium]